MSKVKIFIEASAIVPTKMSGIGHLVLETVREIERRADSRYEYYLFVPFGEGEALKRYDLKYVNIKQLPFPHKIFSLLSRFKYGIPIDLFLGKGVYVFPNYRNLTLLYSKNLTYIHDISYALFPQYTEPKNLIYLRNNMTTWLKRADRLITISNTSRDEIAKYFPASTDKLRVVKPGVDKTIFFPRSIHEVEEMKKKYNLPNDYFLYVGNIEPRKNLKTLIEGYSSDESLKKYSLFLVGGGGWLNEDVSESIARANNEGYRILRNKSYVEDADIPPLMSGAKAVLLPSHHEGFGLSVIQARACHTPVILSDIPVLHEVGGAKAIYFDNKNPQSLHKSFHTALSTDRVKVHNTEIDDWSQSVDDLEKVVNEVV